MTAMATRGQLTVIAAGLAEHGAKARDHRLAIVTSFVGRDIESTKELTADEAHRFLRYVETVEEIGEMPLLVEQYKPEVTG